MFEVAFIVPCMQAISLPSNNNSAILSSPSPMAILGPTLLLRPRQVPTEFSFSVVIGIRGLDLFRDTPPALAWTLTSPEGEVVFRAPPVSLKMTSPPPNSPPLPPEEANAIVGANIQNVRLPVQGHYRLTVTIDGERVASQEIPVRILPQEDSNHAAADS